MQIGQRHPLLLRLVLALLLGALIAPAAAAAWTWPVPGPVLQGFAFDETDPLRAGQHRGIDIAGPLGAQVLAPTAGTVTFVGKVAANGLTVTIETPDGYVVTLLHLGLALVTRGASVAEGQPVALVGSSGVPQHAEPYVQLGVRLVTDPLGYLDPQTFLPPLPGSRPAEPPQPDPAADPGAGVSPAPVPPAAVPPPPAGSPKPAPVSARTVARALAPERPGQPAPPARMAAASPLTAPSSQVTSVPKADAAVPGSPRITGSARLDLRPEDVELSALRRAPRLATSSHAPAQDGAAGAASAWLRSPDPYVAPGRRASVAADGPTLPRPALLALAIAGALAICLCGRRFCRRPARIMVGDALLPDDPDLLREREPAHRPRVHDDRGRHARPAPQAAR